MFVLKNLWIAELDDNSNSNTSNYKDLLLQIASDKASIYSALSPDICKRLETLEEKETELRLLEEYTAFSKGFRMVVKIMLDVLVCCPKEK